MSTEAASTYPACLHAEQPQGLGIAVAAARSLQEPGRGQLLMLLQSRGAATAHGTRAHTREGRRLRGSRWLACE